jgi:hypothetical protein
MNGTLSDFEETRRDRSCVCLRVDVSDRRVPAARAFLERAPAVLFERGACLREKAGKQSSDRSRLLPIGSRPMGKSRSQEGALYSGVRGKGGAWR